MSDPIHTYSSSDFPQPEELVQRHLGLVAWPTVENGFDPPRSKPGETERAWRSPTLVRDAIGETLAWTTGLILWAPWRKLMINWWLPNWQLLRWSKPLLSSVWCVCPMKQENQTRLSKHSHDYLHKAGESHSTGKENTLHHYDSKEFSIHEGKHFNYWGNL